jgi:hypothetical protein
MDLVNKNFEVEILDAFRVAELRGMTERAVTGFAPGAAMILKRVVAAIARRGFDDRVPTLYFRARGNKLEERIIDVSALFSRNFATNHVVAFLS